MTPVPVTPVTPYHIQFFHDLCDLKDNPLMWGFIIAILIDIATGFYKSLVATKTQHKTQSTKGLLGLLKHTVVIGAVLLLYPFLQTIGYGGVGDVLVIYFIITYATSILENCDQANIPIPKFIKEHLAKLQDDYDKGDFPNKWKL